MTRLMLSILLFAAPVAAIAADDFKVSQLEQQVLALQRDVSRMSQELEQLRSQWMRSTAQLPLPQLAPPRPTNNDLWLDASKWQRIKVGMSELQVIELLGPPTSIRAENQDRVLLYAMEVGSSGILGGRVTLRERAVVATNAPVLQ